MKIKLFVKNLLIIFCSIIFLECNSGHSPVSTPESKSEPLHLSLNKEDSLAIVAIYNKIGPWDNKWNLNNIQTWSGVNIAKEKNKNEYRIIGFNYNGSFHGTIPEEFKQLTELRNLGLGGGTLQGNIPSWIGDLKNLENLYIGYNSVSGNIPPEIGKLKKLNQLTIGNNLVSGELPEELGELNNLEELTIMDTKISGQIPTSLGKLKKLKRLLLIRNKLTGKLPIEILSTSMMVNCQGNNITELPIEVWSDENNIYPPDLQGNRLSGTIPESIKKTKKWGKYSFCIGKQQKGFGYSNFK